MIEEQINPLEGLKESARELAIQRIKVATIQEQIKIAEDDLKATKPYQAIEILKKDLADLQAEASATEDNVRHTALFVGIEIQNKNPAPGLTITKKTSFKVDDESKAIEACRDRYPQLIIEKLDTTALKKIVVALNEAIEGTTLFEAEYGQVKIATNLSELYLTDQFDAIPF